MSKLVYKNFFFLFLVQFSNYVLPFLVIPLLTRALGVEGFGKYAFYLGVANLLLVFIRFGFEFSATRQISVNSDNKQKVGEIVGAVIQIKLILFIVTAIIYSLIIFLFKPDQLNGLLLLGGLLLLLGQTLLPIWYFQGMQQMKYVTFYTVVTKIIYVGLLFIVIREKQDYGIAVVIYGLSFFVAGLLSLIQVIRSVPLSGGFMSGKVKEVFNEALPFFTSRVCVTTYTSSITPLIGFIGSPTQVAIYSASEKLYMAAQSLMYPLANALFPHVAKNKDVSLFKKLFVGAVSLMLVGSVIGYFIAPWLIDVLFGAEFYQSTQIFNLHLIALIFVFPSILLGYPLLAALGFSKEANGSVIIGAILFFIIVAGLFLLNLTDATYFVWAVIATEASVFFIRGYMAMTRVFKVNSVKPTLGDV